MKKFRVFVRGENFFWESEGAVKRFGFYTTRFVEAADENEAELRAVDTLRQDEKLRGNVLNDKSDLPMLFVEEIEEIPSFDDIENRSPGLALYEDQKTTH